MSCKDGQLRRGSEVSYYDSEPLRINANIVRRIRYQVMSATVLDFKSEGNKLAELIKQYNISS